MLILVPHGSRKKRWYFSSVNGFPFIFLAGRRLPCRSSLFLSPALIVSGRVSSLFLSAMQNEPQIPSAMQATAKASCTRNREKQARPERKRGPVG